MRRECSGTLVHYVQTVWRRVLKCQDLASINAFLLLGPDTGSRLFTHRVPVYPYTRRVLLPGLTQRPLFSSAAGTFEERVHSAGRHEQTVTVTLSYHGNERQALWMDGRVTFTTGNTTGGETERDTVPSWERSLHGPLLRRSDPAGTR